MKYIKKIWANFIKIFTSFAKPIPNGYSRSSTENTSSINVTTTFAALTRELSAPRHIVTNEPVHASYEPEQQFGSRKITARASVEEESSRNVIVLPMPKTEIAHVVPEAMQETEIIVERELPIDFVIAEVSPLATLVEPNEEKSVLKVKRTRNVKTSIEAKLIPEEPISKVQTKTKNAPLPSVKVIKKVVKKSAPTKPRTRKSKEVPPEAMGFGF